jgi:hypothetical protein
VWTFIVRPSEERRIAAWAVRGVTPFLLRWVPKVWRKTGERQTAVDMIGPEV